MGEEAKKGIGKLKIGLVISVIVIVVLAGSNIWFYMNKQSLELQIGDLWDNYSSEQRWHSYYQNLPDQLSTEKANLQNQVNLLTTERDNLQNQVNSLTSQVTSLQAQYDTLNASYYEALANVTSLQTDLTNMTNWKNSLQVQVTVLQGQIDDLNTQIAEKDATIADLQAQIDDLEDQIDELNTIIAQKDAMIAEKNATIADLEAQIDELERLLEYEVYVLNDGEYYYSIKSDLESATETILVAMYSMIYDPGDPFDWANDLIIELVNAKEKGVNVTVIIENRTYFGYMGENLEAYDYLSAHNVTVRLDNETDTDHMKLVVIDDNVVYVGSHNWSESGLYYNHETSVKIVSEDIAEIFRAYFETI